MDCVSPILTRTLGEHHWNFAKEYMSKKNIKYKIVYIHYGNIHMTIYSMMSPIPDEYVRNITTYKYAQ